MHGTFQASLRDIFAKEQRVFSLDFSKESAPELSQGSASDGGTGEAPGSSSKGKEVATSSSRDAAPPPVENGMAVWNNLFRLGAVAEKNAEAAIASARLVHMAIALNFILSVSF